MVQVDDLYDIHAKNSGNEIIISFYLSTKRCIEQCGNNIIKMEQVIQELDQSIIGDSDIIEKFKEILTHHCEKMKQHQTIPNNLIYESLLSTPCALCAQIDHPMLIEKISRNRGKRLEYNCPIAYHTDWKSTHEEQSNDIYRVCPSKLAKGCNYYQMEVIRVYTNMVTNNQDRAATTNLHEVQLESLKICEEKRPGFCITRCEGLDSIHLGGIDNSRQSYLN
jgi:hypothetical protein